MMLDGPMDTLAFEAYVEQVLIPALPSQAIVVMDNLSAHKSCTTVRMLQQAGAEVCYLPPYSPDFNPIEMMWSKVKSYLRSARARTEEELHTATAAALSTITSKDTEGYFRHCFVGVIN